MSEILNDNSPAMSIQTDKFTILYSKKDKDCQIIQKYNTETAKITLFNNDGKFFVTLVTEQGSCLIRLKESPYAEEDEVYFVVDACENVCPTHSVDACENVCPTHSVEDETQSKVLNTAFGSDNYDEGMCKILESSECLIKYEGDSLNKFNVQSVECDIIQHVGLSRLVIRVQTQEDMCIVLVKKLECNYKNKPIFQFLEKFDMKI